MVHRYLPLLLGSHLLTVPAALAQRTYLHCGRLLDMRSDRAQVTMTVVVESGRGLVVEKD